MLLTCQSHHCNFMDVVKAAGLQPLMLRYDYDPAGRFDSRAYAEMQRKQREAEQAAETAKRELRIWHQKVNQWECAAASAFATMIAHGRTPEALYTADLWHQALSIARMYRERLWTLQKASGVSRSKLGEVDCYIKIEPKK